MKRLALPIVSMLVATAVVVGSASGQDVGKVTAKPQPAYLGDTVRIRAWWFADATRSECTPRVKFRVQVRGRWKHIATANVPRGGVVVHDWVARGIKPGHYLLGAMQRCSVGPNGNSGDLVIEGPTLAVRPDWPHAGQTVTITGRGWASPENCERRVALSLRRPGVVEKIGRPKVRKRKFSVKWNAEAPDAARDWKLVAIQRCKARGKSFRIKQTTGMRIEGVDAEAPPESETG